MMPSNEPISVEAYLFIEVRDKAYRYRIQHTVTPIGSGEDNVVRIKEPSVEEHHALLTYVDGHFFIRRLRDAPLRLNDERLEGYSAELRYGDVIGIGDVLIRLAQGGSISEVAVGFSCFKAEEEPQRPWLFYLSRRTEIRLGDVPADLILPGAGSLLVENFGIHLQYVVPGPSAKRVKLNEEPVERRKRIKDKDILSVPGYAIRIRLLRGDAIEDPEDLLWPDLIEKLRILPEKTR